MPVSGGTTPPAKERVPLAVTPEFERRVEVGGVELHVMIDLDGVVDDELDGLKRIDSLRIASKPHDAVAHRGEVHDRGHAGEILKQHPGRSKGNLLLHCGRHVPPRHRGNVLGVNESAVLAAQQILEEDLQGVRQPRDASVACALERRQTVDVVRGAAGGQPGPRRKGILGSHPLIILHRTWRAQVHATPAERPCRLAEASLAATGLRG